MNQRLCFILIALFAAGCEARSRSAGEASLPGPPSMHELIVKVPSRLVLQKKAGMTMLNFDTEAREPVTLLMTPGLTAGVDVAYRLYWDGHSRPAEPDLRVLVDRTDFEVGNRPMSFLDDRKQTVDVEITIFETDAPRTEFWMPQNAARYQVLLRKTLTLDYQPPPMVRAEAEPDAGNLRPGFPSYPPIANADPTRRENLLIQVPTRMKIERTDAMIAVSVDTQSFEPQMISIGANMILGERIERRLYARGQPRPADFGQLGMSSHLHFGIGGTSFYHRHEGIPQPGVSYIIENEFVIFETDIPPQHLWSPHSPKSKDVWRKTVIQIVP